MGHKISKEEAVSKYEHDMHNRELIKQGKKINSSRRQRKRKLREESKKKWYEMLKLRGGLAKKDKDKERMNQNRGYKWSINNGRNII